MNPRKLASTPASSSGKSRPRKRSSTNTSISTVASATTSRSPTTVTASSSASPTQHNEPTSPLSWYAGISAMSVSMAVSASFSASAQSTVSSGASFNYSSSTQPAVTTSISGSFQPQPTPPDRPQRPQSIPISFLINPVPQSPRPFAFSSPAPSSPSPPPFEASSVVTAPYVEQSSTRPHQFDPQCRSGSPTLPPATIPSHRHLLSAPTTSRSLSERRSYSTSTLSQLNTHAGNSLSYSAVGLTTHPESSVERHPTVFSTNPSTSTSKKSSTNHADDVPTSNGIDFNHSASMDSVRQKRSISNGTGGSSGSNRGRSRRSNNKAIKDEQQQHLQQLQQQQQAIARNEEPAPQQAILRRTTNPDVKTTKTGKILHKPKKAGVNKKNTTYNRFLQQRSKYFAKHHPQLSPQQRMKLIAEEWAVSEKNAHTTRRRSRFPTDDSGTRQQQQQRPSDPVLLSSSSSSSSLPATATAYSSSSSTGSHAVTRSSSDTTNTTNTSISSSASSSSFAITSTVSTPHDPFSTNTRREAGPFRLVNSYLSRTAPTTSTTITTPTRPADASAAVVELSQPRTRSFDCIPPSSSSVYIEQDRMDEEEYEE